MLITHCLLFLDQMEKKFYVVRDVFDRLKAEDSLK